MSAPAVRHTDLPAEAPPSWGLRAKGLTGGNGLPGGLSFSHVWDREWNAFARNRLTEDKPRELLSGPVAGPAAEFALA